MDTNIINVLSWASIRSKYKYKKQRDDLSLQHITALLIIVESAHDGIYQKDLIKRLKWSKQNVLSGSRYLGKLLDLGLIERRRLLFVYLYRKIFVIAFVLFRFAPKHKHSPSCFIK